mgnify:CR=1 FL=1
MNFVVTPHASPVAAATRRKVLADPGFGKIFSDHMVLQRDQQTKIWGWAEPGEKVTVTLQDAKAETTADDEGRWQVQLDPPAAGGGKGKPAASPKPPAVVVISAAIESEIAQLGDAESREYLEAIGLPEPGLDRLIHTGYELLDLVTFFTTGPKETRAWTVPRGTKAPQAAGVIHSDFERGFIKAETVAYDDLVACGSVAAALFLSCS